MAIVCNVKLEMKTFKISHVKMGKRKIIFCFGISLSSKAMHTKRKMNAAINYVSYYNFINRFTSSMPPQIVLCDVFIKINSNWQYNNSLHDPKKQFTNVDLW